MKYVTKTALITLTGAENRFKRVGTIEIGVPKPNKPKSHWEPSQAAEPRDYFHRRLTCGALGVG